MRLPTSVAPWVGFCLALAVGGSALAAQSETAPAAKPLPAPTSDTQKVMAELHLHDLNPGGGPMIVVDGAPLRPFGAQTYIDARIFNILLIRKSRYVRQPMAASTTQAIDAWTSAVLVDAPAAYGTSVDQWIAMAYLLGPRW